MYIINIFLTEAIKDRLDHQAELHRKCILMLQSLQTKGKAV